MNIAHLEMSLLFSEIFSIKSKIITKKRTMPTIPSLNAILTYELWGPVIKSLSRVLYSAVAAKKNGRNVLIAESFFAIPEKIFLANWNKLHYHIICNINFNWRQP